MNIFYVLFTVSLKIYIIIFSSQLYLKGPMETHTGEKSHSSKVCADVFSCKLNL